MQFSRIKLENWRNFSQVDVALQTRVFLVGANASGKSNFLDVFRFLRDLVMPGGGFQEAIAKRGGVSIIRNLAARHPNTDIAIEVEFPEGVETTWRYRIMLNQDNHRRPVLKGEKIWLNDELLLDRPDPQDRADKARLSQTLLEQTFVNREFRKIAEVFRSINYVHVIPQLVRDPEHSNRQAIDSHGSDLIEQMASVRKEVQETRLRRTLQAIRIAVPQLSALELVRDDQGDPHLRAKFEGGQRQGSWQTENLFSDGTVRLIGLLWALQDGNGPLLIEEPELSLHPGVVRRLPQIIRHVQREMKGSPRQILISTHSSELLSDVGIAPDEILLFSVSSEGSQIRSGASFPAVLQELDAGLTMADIVLPRTEPPDVRQLA